MNEKMDHAVYQNIRETLLVARKHVQTVVNAVMVEAYWNIGKQIIEAQGNSDRADYGSRLLVFLSEKLTAEFGKGFTESNLRRMRQFYLLFQNRATVCHELSWSHLRLLFKIEEPKVRDFYINECTQGHWSVRQLERQINSFYYERLLSSRDKDAVRNEIHTLEKPADVKDVIRDPYVLEFLGLEQSPSLYEKDLEKGLINHLQKFLLELGRGFSFEARQKHIALDDEHFYIDLVFYNYILRCFVLVDLKVGKLTHQHIGQMQMYVNYYTRELKNDGDNLPIGIILCADKSESVVRYTLPTDNNQIYASKYKLCLPTEDELKQALTREQEAIEREIRLGQ